MWGNAVEDVGGFQPTGGVSDVYDELIVYRHSVCISVSQYTTDYFAFCAQIMDW